MEECLPTRFHWKDPASLEQLNERQRSLNVLLPKEYREFLCLSNGGYGILKDGRYVELYGIDDVNFACGEGAPNILIIGSDGGGEAIAFDVDSEAFPLVFVPFIPMDRKEILPLAENFFEFSKLFPRKS